MTLTLTRRSSARRPGGARIAGACAALAALTALAACSGTEANSDAADEPVSVAYLNATASVPVLVANQEGFFETHGVDVALTGVPNPAAGLQALGRDFDVAMGTPTDVVLGTANGRDMVAFSGAYEDSKDLSLWSTVANADVQSLAELKGRTIAVVSLSGTTYSALLNAISEEGLAEDDFNIVQVALPDMAAQLAAGSVDAIVSTSPFREPLLGDPAYRDLGNPTLTVADPTLGGVYLSTSSWLNSNSAKVSDFMAAISDAHDWIAENPGEARSILAKELGLPPTVGETLLLPEYTTDLSTDDIQPWIDVLERQGATPAGSMPEVASLVFAS